MIIASFASLFRFPYRLNRPAGPFNRYFWPMNGSEEQFIAS
jgi:hypothetical protein